MLDDILSGSSLTAKQAESLRGRLHWFESFAYGRVANGAVRTLGNLALRGSKNITLSPREVRDLRFLGSVSFLLRHFGSRQPVSFHGSFSLTVLVRDQKARGSAALVESWLARKGCCDSFLGVPSLRTPWPS